MKKGIANEIRVIYNNKAVLSCTGFVRRLPEAIPGNFCEENSPLDGHPNPL